MIPFSLGHFRSRRGVMNAARLNAARLETTDMLRQLQRNVAGTAGAEEAEQREVTVRLSE